MSMWMELHPVVVCLEDASELVRCAADVFTEEVALRTGWTLKRAGISMRGVDTISILEEKDFRRLYSDKLELLDILPVPGAEGFRLFFEMIGGKRMNIYAVGSDPRGTFYAMGKLLRVLRLSKSTLQADTDFAGVSETPEYGLRGHQLGYRDKQNTLPCWDDKQFDRYIRELALFGSNAIELLPPRTDDNLFSREMRLDPFDLMVRAAKSVKRYGLDLWLWYPNMGKNYEDPTVLAQELEEREKVFAALPEISGMLVPAGDPGELEPNLLFSVTEKCAIILHRYHPKAKVMLAPQCFAPEPGWYDAFYANVSREPAWLYGVSFAPWEQDSIEEMVRRLPLVYRNRIRHYPDVTHDIGCQFALPQRAPAYALIEGRECCDPRPRALKHIHNTFAPYCMGSITYSEGVHDDLNKFVWGQQDWNSQQNAEVTVREYVRLFIDSALEDEITRGVSLLEQTWDAPCEAACNPFAQQAYELFMDVDAKASDTVRGSWRYQLLLLRALADRYISAKQHYDEDLETQARRILARAGEIGSQNAVRKAFEILDLGRDEPCLPLLRARIQRLADELHTSCGIKLTTSRHGGQKWNRGAWIDMLDTPLSDAQYLRISMKRLARLQTEEARLEAIRAMLHRTDPGEGGVYVDLGSPESRALIVNGLGFAQDPSLLHTPFTTVDGQMIDLAHTYTDTWRECAVPKALFTCIQTYYRQPLTLRVPVPDDDATYDLKVAYCLGGKPADICLTLEDGQVVHQRIEAREDDTCLYTYPLPKDCVRNGAITLTWSPYGRVRGVKIHEMFLIRTRP